MLNILHGLAPSETALCFPHALSGSPRLCSHSEALSQIYSWAERCYSSVCDHQPDHCEHKHLVLQVLVSTDVMERVQSSKVGDEHSA